MSEADDPAVRQVLEATVADEEGHQDLGWTYVETSLARFPKTTLSDWRHLVEITIAPHRDQAARILGGDRSASDEPELAALGLFSPRRQATVYERCWKETLEPKLRALSLL